MEPLDRYVPATGTPLQRVLAAAEDREAVLQEQETTDGDDPPERPGQPSTSGP